jgi:transposase, IS6 family
VDCSGAALDFYLSESHEAAAAKCFFRKVLAAAHPPRPRVINVDSNPAYPKVVEELKQERKLGRRSRCRTCPP